MRKLPFLLGPIVLFLLLINLSSAKFAGSVRLLNGNNWTSWSHDEKLAFMGGFISDGDWVASNSLFSEALFPNEGFRQRSKALWEEATSEAGKVKMLLMKIYEDRENALHR